MALGSVSLNIHGNTSGLARDIDRGLGGALKKLPALAAASGIGLMFKGFIDGARESARIGRITENVIKSTGQAAGVTASQVGALATAISNKTGADDEAIQSGQNLLLTFTNVRDVVGKNNDIFTQASKAAVDMAAGLNNGEVSAEGIKGVSLQLGKALNDPIQGMTALTRSGVSFTEQQKKQVKEMVGSNHMLDAQKLILGELQKEFGGAAAAAADPLTRLQTIAGNLGESIGGLLLPYVDRFATVLGDKVIPAITTFLPHLQEIGSEIKDRIGPVIAPVVDAFQRLGQTIMDAAPGLQNLAASMAPALIPFQLLATEVLPVLIDGVGLLFTALSGVGDFFSQHSTTVGAFAVALGTVGAAMIVVTAASAAWAAVTGGLVTAFWALNAALYANPIGAVVIGVAALAAGLVFAWKKSETFRDVVTAAFNGLVSVVANVVKAWANLILGFWEGVLNAIGAIPFAKKVIPGLQDATNAVHNFRVAANNEIDSIKTNIHIVATADASQAINQLKMLQAAQAAAAGKLIGPIIPGTKRPTVANGFGSVSAPKISLSGGGAKAPTSGGGGSVGNAASKKAAADDKKKAAAAAKKAAAAAKAAAAKVRATADKAVGAQVNARGFVDSVTGGQDAINTAFDKLIASLKAGNKAKLATYAAGIQKQLLAIGLKRDAVSEQLTMAADKLADLRKESEDYAKSVRDSIASTGNIATHNIITFTGIRNSLRAAVRQANEFKTAIVNLTAAGLNKQSLQDLIAAGPEAGLAAAKSLMQGGVKGITEVNDLTAQLGAAGQSMGDQTAATFYNAGIQAAAGLVAGLQSQEAALNAQMDKMATQMANTLKKQLKIKSPSQVFAGIGRFIGAGLAQGIDASRGRVGAAAGRMGGNVINNFGGVSVSGLADPVQMERGGIMAGYAIANTLQRTQAAMNLAGIG